MDEDTEEHRAGSYKKQAETLKAQNEVLVEEITKIRELSYHAGCDDYPCALDVIRNYCEFALRAKAQTREGE